MAQDVKIFRPQRLTDNPDGGGLASSVEVIDGEANNLFDDISRIDRVNGDISLRKAFVQAATADTELFSGLHVILQAPPLDPKVSAVLFKTDSWSDERDQARMKLERFLDESVLTRLIPYDRQLEGQRTVMLFTRPEIDLPEIGFVYVLKNDTAGQTEFIKVTDISSEVQTFTDTIGDFLVRVITLEISQPLTQDFLGTQPNRYFTAEAVSSTLRSTVASDAAKYRGIKPLSQNAEAGDLTIFIDSPFMQLVPSATTEVPIIDAEPFGTTSYIPASDDLYQTAFASYGQDGGLNAYHLMLKPAFPLILRSSLPDQFAVEQADGSFLIPSQWGGSMQIDPGRTRVVATGVTSGWAYTLQAEYVPVAAVSRTAFTNEIFVDTANRGYVYTMNLQPIPAPGSTVVSFRSMGQWYELVDDGSGALRGPVGTGTGLVNFGTGTVNITLGALPDTDSAILFAWGGSSDYEIRDASVDAQIPKTIFTVQSGNIEPGTLEIVWGATGYERTVTDNGSGSLVGDAVGKVIYSTGQVMIIPVNVIPDPGSFYAVSYQSAEVIQDVFTPVQVGTSISLAAGTFPIRPRSLEVEFVLVKPDLVVYVTKKLYDNGSGKLIDEDGVENPGSSVNYGSGLIVFNPNLNVQASINERREFEIFMSHYTGGTGGAPVLGNWPAGSASNPAPGMFEDGSAVTVRYKADSVDDSPFEETVEAPPFTLDFTPLTSNHIVPNTLAFIWTGKTYYDRNGSIYTDFIPATGSGTLAGTIDYSTGIATITEWGAGWVGAEIEIDVISLLTEVNSTPMSALHGRVRGAPVRPGTFSIRATQLNGTVVSATADNNGNFSTGNIHGTIDSQTGVFTVGFGRWVLDSTLSPEEKLEEWYDADYVLQNGYIWQPKDVVPGTVFYNAVVQSTVAQDSELIGINPVRLPMDGRVPGFRTADTLVIQDPQIYSMPNGLIAGQEVQVGRTNVNSITLYDTNGLGVPVEFYEVDLIAGEVKMATPLNLTGYVQPLKALHVIEDMALALDVQITGEIKLGQPLTHSYDADTCFVASALIIGDVQARYQGLFSQQTWLNVWADSRQGDPPSSGAQYNDLTFPLEVLNRDAITMRWALVFTSSDEYNIVAEELGVIGTGDIYTDAAPINPATGFPYVQVFAEGFGTGWSTGNVIRFNTFGAGGPIWVSRTVQPGVATFEDDRIRLQARWDKD